MDEAEDGYESKKKKKNDVESEVHTFCCIKEFVACD